MRADILDYFDTEVRMRKGKLAAEYRRELDGNVRRTIGPFASAWHNWIDHHQLHAANFTNAIEEQVDYFSSIAHSFRWKVYSHDQPVGIADELRRLGFEEWESCALMILDVAKFPQQGPEGVRYETVEDPMRLPAELQPIKEEVWDEGADELICSLQSEMRDLGAHMRVLVAKREDRTVGCGLVRYNERMTFGGLFAGATVPGERGKGIYRGMVASRVEDARRIGVEYLYTEAGAMSRPILDRLGFHNVCTMVNFAYEISADSVS